MTMRHKFLAACLAGLALLTLSGCLRQSAYYYIQPDNTVDGTIYIALDEAYTNASDPYRGTGAGDIAAYFDHATITAFDNAKWKGYHVDFIDEPVATFAGSVTDTWGIQILKDADNQYVINGYTPTASDDSMRQTILDDDGFMQLTVSFPGTLIQQTEAKETSASGETPGWAAWDMLTVANAPTGRGNGGFLFHYVPGIDSLFFPSGDPVPNPTTSAAPEAPQPVVTVVVTPSAQASPSTSPAASPSPTPTPSAANSDGSGSGVPAWVWIAGAALLVALAGLTGAFVATSRGKRGAASPAPATDAPAAVSSTSEAPKSPTSADGGGDQKGSDG
jgi:hypothetical protein